MYMYNRLLVDLSGLRMEGRSQQSGGLEITYNIDKIRYILLL